MRATKVPMTPERCQSTSRRRIAAAMRRGSLTPLCWLAACGGSQQATAAPAPDPGPPARPAATTSDTALQQPGPPPWLSVDSAGRSVTLTLETTSGGGGAALINGYRQGGARLVVPVGWTVKWSWRNSDPGSAHSLVVMTQREKIPAEGGRSAFSNALTRSVTSGLASGQTDQTTFEAEEAGWYWLLCGVPSHALNGEWLELRVDPDAKTAGVTLKSPSPR